MGPLEGSPDHDAHAVNLERMLQDTGGLYSATCDEKFILLLPRSNGPGQRIAAVKVASVAHCCSLWHKARAR
jgi:hypothetical protein